MLALKLTIVPLFLLAVSLAGKYYGPGIAGWLAGLPIVAGPILYFVAVDNGAHFASISASSSAAAVFASVSFSLVYARTSMRYRWSISLVSGLAVWLCAAAALSALPSSPLTGGVVALITLLGAPRLFPVSESAPISNHITYGELVLRMAAGALLTLTVTLTAKTFGATWSGLLAVFPVLGIVLAVFSQRRHGASYSAVLLRSMVTGLYSFALFCVVLSLSLDAMPIPAAFVIATIGSLVVQAISRRRVMPHASPITSSSN